MEIVKTKLTDLQIKTSVFKLTTLNLSSNDLRSIAATLNKKMEQAPQFFNNTPVVLDVNEDFVIDKTVFSNIVSILNKYSMKLIAVKASNSSIISIAREHNIAIVSEQSNNIDLPEDRSTKVVSNVVRSGQQIYVSNSDLVILASISSGAELLADGHIHIYAKCRGRILAGINGNTSSMIFCSDFDAELVSIAGHYIVREDIPKHYFRKSVKICLNNGELIFQLI